MHTADKKTELRSGVNVMIILAVMTVVEFVIAVVVPSLWSVLVIVALIKAAVVVQNYMHLPRLFTEEGGH